MALLGQGMLPRTPLAQIKLLRGTVIHIQPMLIMHWQRIL